MKPDFAVTSLNQSDVSGDAGVVRVWASKPGIAKAGDAGDAQQAAGMLAAGESRTFAFALSVPTRPGTHHARAFVDADDGADENNEGNNQKKTSYKPQDAGTQPLPAAVELRNLEQTYDGAEKTVAVATDPAGLAVEITYDVEFQAPVGAGTYQVVATVVDEKYAGSAADALAVAPVEAKVILSDLEQIYDGEPKPVSFATDPKGLKVRVTYYTVDPPSVSNGLSVWHASEQPPVKPGSYPVTAHVEDPNYYGKAGGTLMIVEEAPATVKVLVVSASGVNVRENGEGRFFVCLNQDPGAIVRIAVTRSAGDAGLTIQTGMALTFRSSNWSKWQAVTLAGTDDANPDNEEATFQISTLGMEDQYVLATALDDDIGENVALASSGSMISGTKATHPEYLIDGIQTVSTNFGYTCWTNLSSPGTITLDLKAETAVSRIRLLNWDWDAAGPSLQDRVVAERDGLVADASGGCQHGRA